MIGDRLRELRGQRKLTLKEMGEKLGVSHMTYQRYEKNDVDVSTDMLDKLADFYGVSTDYLLGREPPTNPLATYNVTTLSTDVDAFCETYKKLPENIQNIFIDTIKKLSEAVQEHQNNSVSQ